MNVATGDVLIGIAARPRSCDGVLIQAPRLLPTPRRHQRSRKRGARTPEGVIYCGRPTVRGNPFDWRRFGFARSFKLYGLWARGQLGIIRLEQLGFCPSEIDALVRWRRRLWDEMPRLRGCDLQCWCPLTSRWCHVEVILALANRASGSLH